MSDLNMINFNYLICRINSPISPKTCISIRKSHTMTTHASSNSGSGKWSISNGDYLTGDRSLAFKDGLSWKRHQNEIMTVLRNLREDSLDGLNLIDALQRLCIDYHFRQEIETVLNYEHKRYKNPNYPTDELYGVSTRFRLLRQDGYIVNADVFQKFMTNREKSNPLISRDIRGLVGLYEASQLSMEGEDVLDRAGEYSTKCLDMWIKNLDYHQARMVGNTLHHPCHKSLSMFMAKYFIRDHKYQNRWVNVLHELADMEFNFVRARQNEEIFQVLKWWRETGLAKELKFARDQPLKWYMWPAATLTDPCLSKERVDLTKIISFIYIIDDIYDVHGTLDELILFTEAVNRWDFSALEQLPDYMKICFKALDKITNEISYDIYIRHGLNPIDHLRRTWSDLCDAFLVEAEWFSSGQLPKADEYLKNGIISSGMHIVLVHIFFMLGHGVNNESTNLVSNNPSIITSAATILRLSDDLGSAKDENQDGNDGSFLKCYMKDTCCSEETARQKVSVMISDSWKRLNKEALSSKNPLSATFRKCCLNMARMVPLMYMYDENSSLPILEEHMKSILYSSTEP